MGCRFLFRLRRASAAYLTASEIFPLETRALAIAFFYAIGTAVGGLSGPPIFGALIATRQPANVFYGYLIGAAFMIAAGLIEARIGLNCERQSLESIANLGASDVQARARKGLSGH